MRAIWRELGRIRIRLLLVNLAVVLVPVVGLEFARVYERQLLDALERDMHNQAALVREMVEAGLVEGAPVGDARYGEILRASARNTRTRIRLVTPRGRVVVDSHAFGPPEGPEPPPPSVIPASLSPLGIHQGTQEPETPREAWPEVGARREILSALSGRPDSRTRVRRRAPAVFLFIAEPIRHQGEVAGVVYITRSTQPVLEELYKVRTGLIELLLLALVVTLLVTLALAWSISRPLARLANAARRIAGGEDGVRVPVGGSGEIRELGEAFSTMTERLDERIRYTEQFTADVAHEFKSPLTSIRGAAELLLEGASEDLQTRMRFLNNIELDAERLDRLVTGLLELSRLDASKAPMHPFDLRAMLERVLERCDTPEQPVTLDYRAALRTYRGREADLERAVLNLVENALRFSPTSEAVKIEVDSIVNRELHIRVRDRGPGIEESLRSKIFERFFTTDAERDGTGLGLSIVATVAQAHRGRIALDETAAGATFVLALPLTAR